ncbi:hypothetical protein [Leptolyngbya sp. 7M]|uniref:hypothetical protein n=1 Tax=Leptolyngbya sp. 7M TaxID=2812896 RepID=UPI001B8B9810|nr:hypothetical protein [Leptolyngbya sp. 7M]QYO64451.1 hypothetical protein JVX88_33025 [Leptolyngbya sp. 7M]
MLPLEGWTRSSFISILLSAIWQYEELGVRSQELSILANDRLGYLAWLLSRELLKLKLAVHQNPYQQGIYHEKLRILRNQDDQVVVFTGSANQSASGLIANFECIDVFRSWRLQ